MVSFWIPWRAFWGYFTGAFLLCAGAMILIRRNERAAAAALGAMILIATAVVYAFRVAGHGGSIGELTNTLKDVGVAGGAFILAGELSHKRQPVATALQSGDALCSPDPVL
jgi:hypothetical protein